MNSAIIHVLRNAGSFTRNSQRGGMQHGTRNPVPHSTTHASPKMKEDGWLFEHNGYTAQLCCSTESKEIAYHLRYRAYRNAGAIAPSSDRMTFDKFDEQPNSRTHLIWYQGKPVASVRSCIWSDRYPNHPTESTTVFRKEIVRCVGLKSNILESAHFVTAPEITGRDSFYAQLLLFRLQDLSSRFDDCPMIITAVQERHIPFYKRVLGFRTISMPRSIDWIDTDLVLLRTRQEEGRQLAVLRGMPECTDDDVQRYYQCASGQLIPASNSTSTADPSIS